MSGRIGRAHPSEPEHGISDSRIFAPHFFAFGGVLETARWLRAVTEGSFELNEAGTGFAELET